jgi:RNA polymerase sigma factor (sigma-70 family)
MARIPYKQVVQELKDGNPLGCRHLVELLQQKLISEAVGVFDLEMEDAEELVDDVLVTAVEKIGDFEFKRGDGDFHVWVVTIFRNRVRDFIRHSARTEVLMERFEENDPADGIYSPGEKAVVVEIVRQYQDSLRDDAPSGAGSAGEKLRIVAETLEEMESWERVLLRCRALDVPYEEIATYTGKPVKQLKVYHTRVKKKFAKLLTERHPEFVQQVAETTDDEA